jgi:hypothetical protein
VAGGGVAQALLLDLPWGCLDGARGLQRASQKNLVPGFWYRAGARDFAPLAMFRQLMPWKNLDARGYAVSGSGLYEDIGQTIVGEEAKARKHCPGILEVFLDHLKVSFTGPRSCHGLRRVQKGNSDQSLYRSFASFLTRLSAACHRLGRGTAGGALILSELKRLFMHLTHSISFDQRDQIHPMHYHSLTGRQDLAIPCGRIQEGFRVRHLDNVKSSRLNTDVLSNPARIRSCLRLKLSSG